MSVRIRVLAASLVVTLGALAVPACHKPDAPPQPPAARFPGAPVFLISIDTLRADRLPAYGYTKVATPALDAFRKEAILFTNAYSHVPLTLPSHASVMTGLLPTRHGVHDNLGYTLAPQAETLASAFKKAGYATGAAVSAIVLSRTSGIARGFDFYDDVIEPTKPNQFVGRVQRAGGETAATLEKWIEETSSPKVFSFLHLYEPHSPYEPPEPFASRYKDATYDGEVATSDEIVGRFLEFLKARGLYDRAVVVVFSDHGEGLGDHGEDEHGIFLSREALHVPLLVRLPGGARGGSTVADTAGLSDLFPTVLEAAGLEAGASVDGALSLLAPRPAAGAPRRVFAETYFPRLHFGWSELSSLVEDRWHYIEGPKPEFFDMGADPREATNLIADRPAAFRTLKIALESMSRSFAKPANVDPEEAAKLASLGYISSGGLADEGQLPDPKDRIASVARLKDAFGFFAQGKYEEAIEGFETLLGDNPKMMDVWDVYAQSLVKVGRTEDALGALKKAIGTSPSVGANFMLSVASLYLKMGKLDDAQRHAELARDKGNPAADDLLCRIYLARKDYDLAEKSARQALAVSSTRRLPYIILARVAMAKGDLPGALAQLDAAERLTAERKLSVPSSLHQIRGDVLGRMNRLAEAEAEFQEEIRRFPDNGDARASLAVLYASQGRLADARHVLDEYLTAYPTPSGYQSAAKVLLIVGDQAGAEELRRRGLARFPQRARPRRGGA